MSTKTEITEEELRIRIAEKCGWKRPDHPDCMARKEGFTMPEVWWMHPDGKLGFENDIPDYTRDLNAMREAVKNLEPPLQRKWIRCLTAIVFEGLLSSVRAHFPSWDHVEEITNATPIQRARAFYAATRND